jgi:ribonuclease D
VDIGAIAQQANFRRHSLQALSALVLGHSICKAQQMSNWTRAKLSDAQITYAATDAWVSRELALRLLPLQSTQPQPSATAL